MKNFYDFILRMPLRGFFLIVSIWWVSFNPLLGATCCNYGIPGSEMMYFSRSMESFALGGVSAGLEMKGGNFVVNPATSATILQKMVMANFGYGTEEITLVNLGYLHPTEYGTFGGYYGHFFDAWDSKDFFFSIGPTFSKEINQLISLGAMITFDYYAVNSAVPDEDVNPFGFSVSMSTVFRPDFNYGKSVFRIKDFIVSIQVDQAGYIPWREWDKIENGSTVTSKAYVKTSDLLKLGAGVTVMEATLPDNFGKWNMRLYNDFALTFPIDFAYHVGLKNAFFFESRLEEFSIMLGHYRDPATVDSFPLSGGLGAVFMIDDEIKMEVNYAFGLNDRENLESYHALGFNIHFGEVDDREPVISSPFGDEGVIDAVEIE